MAQQSMMMGGQPGMQYPGMSPTSQMTPGMAAYQQQGPQAPVGQQGQTALQSHAGYQPQAAAQQALQQQMQYQHLQQQHQQQLQLFWQQQMQEVEQASDFKNHQLPLARIKKIMKADEDVRMISAEAPVVFSKACEMFILELTLRSWIHTEENKRRTLQKNDIAGAITRTDIFDFLVDIVPRDELKEESLGIPRAQVPMPGADMQYGGMFYVPQTVAPPQQAAMASQPGMMAPQMLVGRPAMAMDPNSMYGQQRAPMPQYMQQPQQQQQHQQHQQQQPMQQQQQMWSNQQMPPSSGGMSQQ